MKTVRNVLCYLIIFFVIISLIGCEDSKKKTPQSGSSAVETGSVHIEGMSDWEADEIKKAISAGIVPKEIQNDYKKAVTGKQFMIMLENVVSAKDGNKDWDARFPINTYYSNDPIVRQSAAVIIYTAAQQGLNIKQSNGSGYYFTNVNQFADEVDGKYGKEAVEKDCLDFVTSDFDITSNARLMDVTFDGYFRMNDQMTRKEAIQAAYRLSNSILPKDNYVPMDNVGVLDLTSDQLKEAKALAAPTVEKLPDWHGLTLMQKTFDHNNIYGTLYIPEQDVKIISDLGFNFARVPLNFYNMFESESKPNVNLAQLNNLDDVVKWGIKYHVHICFDFHCLPGYQSASYANDLKNPVDDFFKNKDRQKLAGEIYSMLARHYKNVPSSVLSFDLLNEPLIDSTQTEENEYTPVIKQMIDAVRAADPQRFIIVDGVVCDENGSPARKPVNSLAGQNVAQSMHFYGDVDFANYAFERDGYAPQGWPLPFVNGWLKGNNHPLTIEGNFVKGTNVQISANWSFGEGYFKIIADGKAVYSAAVKPNEYVYNKVYNASLPSDAKTLKIVWTGDKAKINSVTLECPGKSSQPVPFYGAVTGKNDVSYQYKKVTNIICYPEISVINVPSSTVMVDSNGIYTNPDQADLSFNIDSMRLNIKSWVDFSKKNNVAFMVQEFGVANKTPHDMSMAYLKDFLTVLKENNIPWCMWGFEDRYGIFNSGRYDVKYEQYGPYLLDREMLKLLQQFQ